MSKNQKNLPINPTLFWTGKIAGFIIWITIILHLVGYNLFKINSSLNTRYLSYTLFFIGVIISLLAMANLGKSTSVVTPSRKTKLKISGLFKFSRNPIYVAFALLSLSGIILTQNFIILILGIYSIIIYHFIILGEEKFLIKRFGKEYLKYCKEVRRYI